MLRKWIEYFELLDKNNGRNGSLGDKRGWLPNCKEEARTAMKRMKNRKAGDPDAMKILRRDCRRVSEFGHVKGCLTSSEVHWCQLFKNKCDVQS